MVCTHGNVFLRVPLGLLASVAAAVLQLPGGGGEEGAASVQPAAEAGEPGQGRGQAFPCNHDGGNLPAGIRIFLLNAEEFKNHSSYSPFFSSAAGRSVAGTSPCSPAGRAPEAAGTPSASSASPAASCWWTSSTSTRTGRSTAAGTTLRG